MTIKNIIKKLEEEIGIAREDAIYDKHYADGAIDVLEKLKQWIKNEQEIQD